MRRSLVLLLGVLAGGRLAFGCSSDDVSSEGPRAGVDASQDAIVVDSQPDSRGAADADDPDPIPPVGLPSGWEIDRLYSKHCGLYAPKAKENLPPPVRWEACPADVTPSAAGCQLMAIEGDSADPTFPGGAEAASVSADGSVVLAAYRNVEPSWTYMLLADADGPVHQATLMTDPQLCSLTDPTFSGDRFAFHVSEHSASTGGGFVAGEVSAFRPRLAVHLQPSDVHAPYAGSFAILDYAGNTFDPYSWTDGARLPRLPSSAPDDGVVVDVPVFAGGAAFWPASTIYSYEVQVYSAATGVRDFLSAGTDVTHGFGDFGTDGHDMVWIEGRGRTTTTQPFDTYAITTAPFTTDPTQVAPRRLRSEEGPTLDLEHFFVGCGYAARSIGLYIRVVRLADGVSWTLSNALTDPWGWSEPLAVTCTELFATVRTSGQTRLARIRLDSLGPGIAPD